MDGIEEGDALRNSITPHSSDHCSFELVLSQVFAETLCVLCLDFSSSGDTSAPCWPRLSLSLAGQNSEKRRSTYAYGDSQYFFTEGCSFHAFSPSLLFPLLQGATLTFSCVKVPAALIAFRGREKEKGGWN